MSNYWSSAGVQPKRSHRFLVTVGEASPNGGIQQWVVQKMKKPGFNVSETVVNFLNHKFYFPGRVEWEEVELVVVDVVNANIDSSEKFIEVLEGSGYKNPDDILPVGAGANASTISKRKSVGVALGNVKIDTLDDDGRITETWTLHNSWIKKIDFGQLDYGSEEMLNISVNIRYDWAERVSGEQPEATPVVG